MIENLNIREFFEMKNINEKLKFLMFRETNNHEI